MIAIDTPNNDGAGVDSGHTRIYRTTAGSWMQIGEDIDGEAGGDSSGQSISLSSDSSVVAIGATGNDDNGIQSGHLRIYRKALEDWIQIGGDIDGWGADSLAGFSVSISSNGSIAAIAETGIRGSGQKRILKLSRSATEQPAITKIIPLESNPLVGVLNGEPGVANRIQWSANLVDWIDLTSLVGPSPEHIFQDPDFQQTSKRYYQAVSP